jgi:hypothetical protein
LKFLDGWIDESLASGVWTFGDFFIDPIFFPRSDQQKPSASRDQPKIREVRSERTVEGRKVSFIPNFEIRNSSL